MRVVLVSLLLLVVISEFGTCSRNDADFCPLEDQRVCSYFRCLFTRCRGQPGARCSVNNCEQCVTVFRDRNGKVIPRFTCPSSNNWPECLETIDCIVPPERCNTDCPGVPNARCDQNCDCSLVFSDPETGRTLSREECNADPPTGMCPRLSVPFLIYACSNNRRIRSRCRLSCPSDRRLVGGVTNIRCQPGGNWAPNLNGIRCILKNPPPVTCPRHSISYRSVCTNSINVGSRCELSCAGGHLLLGGFTSVTCLRNGEWDSDLSNTRCIPINPRCPAVPTGIFCIQAEFCEFPCPRGQSCCPSPCGTSCTALPPPTPEEDPRCPAVPTGVVCKTEDVCRSPCPRPQICCRSACGALCSTIGPDPRCPPRRLAAVLCPVDPPNPPPRCPASCPNGQSCCPLGCFGFVCAQFPPPCPPGQPQADCIGDPCTGATCPGVPNAVCFLSSCGGCFPAFTESEVGVVPRFACEFNSNWPACLAARSCPEITESSCRQGCPRSRNLRCVHDCDCNVIYIDASNGRELDREDCGPEIDDSCPVPLDPPEGCGLDLLRPTCGSRCPPGEICCGTPCGGSMCRPRPIDRRCPPIPLGVVCFDGIFGAQCPPRCPPGQMCCRNPCGSSCIDIPQDPRCPVLRLRDPMESETCPSCFRDRRCPGSQICCRAGCGSICIDPPTSPPDPRCPAVPTGVFCIRAEFCDLPCPGRQTCCPSACGTRCVVLPPTPPQNPRCPALRLRDPMESETCPSCFRDRRCPGSQICCRAGCGSICITPPPFPPDLRCPAVPTGAICVRAESCDSPCPRDQICCPSPCGSTCTDVTPEEDIEEDPRCSPRRLANIACPLISLPLQTCPRCTEDNVCCPVGCTDFTCTQVPPDCAPGQAQPRCAPNACSRETCPSFPEAACFETSCGGCIAAFTTQELGVIPKFACQFGSNWPSCLAATTCLRITDRNCDGGCPASVNIRCVMDCDCSIVYTDASNGETVERSRCDPHPRCPLIQPVAECLQKERCEDFCRNGQICCPTACGTQCLNPIPVIDPTCPPVIPRQCPPPEGPLPSCPPECPPGERCCNIPCGGSGCVPRPDPRCPVRPTGVSCPFIAQICEVPCPEGHICCPSACGTTCVDVTPEPSCPPPIREGARVSFSLDCSSDDYEVGTTCRVRCPRSRPRLIGTRRIRCRENRRWTPALGTTQCVRRTTCPVPLTRCTAPPCRGVRCPAIPEATCVATYCRECNFEFYLNGRRLNKQECISREPCILSSSARLQQRTCPSKCPSTASCPRRPDAICKPDCFCLPAFYDPKTFERLDCKPVMRG